MKAILEFILHPIRWYRAFCAACEVMEEDTRQIEREGKFSE